VSFSHCRHQQSTSGCPACSPLWRDVDISSLLEMLRSVEDPRGVKGKQHALVFVLAVSVVAVLAGAKGYSEIARKAQDMSQSLLGKIGAEWDWFRLRYKYPSKGTICRVLSGINGDRMDEITGSWLAAQSPKGRNGEWEIAVDGKVLRGSWTDENEQVTLFSAMIHKEGITIAQLRVPDGTNETTQAGALLDVLPVPADEPALFTLDAAHTSSETADAITRRAGWHYLMTVKGNRPSLQRAVFDAVIPFLKGPPHDVMEEYARGQRKRWSIWTAPANKIDFPGAEQAAIIIRETFTPSGDRIGKEMSLMLTSQDAENMTAFALNRHKRLHWGIENKSHYPRDVVYREDNGQAWAGEGPQVLATIRNLAIGLMRMKGIKNIKENTEWIAGDRNRALNFMTT
jgi:DDE_Tnp_1-associated/Transposase DDE domain